MSDVNKSAQEETKSTLSWVISEDTPEVADETVNNSEEVQVKENVIPRETETEVVKEVDSDTEVNLEESSEKSDESKSLFSHESYLTENSVMTKSPILPKTEGDKNVPVSAFGKREPEIREQTREFRRIDKVNIVGREMTLHYDAIVDSLSTFAPRGLFVEELDRKGTEWGQFIPVGDYNIYARTIKSPVLNSKISGVKAISHLRNILGSGESREIPLLTSGFYVTVSPIPDSELSNLEERVMAVKEKHARSSAGIALSATISLLVEEVAKLIIKNISSTNLEVQTNEDLLDYILVTDIQQLAIGQAQAIFPKGYPLIMPCINDPERCNHVEEATVLPRNMVMMDKSKLTNEQKIQMASPATPVTIEQVKKYQENGPGKLNEPVVLAGGKIRVGFKTPTLREYFDDSRAWFGGIEEIVNDLIMDVDAVNARREEVFLKQMTVTTLRQYSHFIKSITIVDTNGEESIIEDRETLLLTLEELSSNVEFSKAVIKGVRKHLEISTVAVVGIPRTPCPECEKDIQFTEEEAKHIKLVPIDAVNLFFTLVRRKTYQTGERRITLD